MSLKEDILIERFLKNELSLDEQTVFVKKMESDKNFKEKVIFEKQLFETLNGKDWSFVGDVDSNEVAEYEALFKNDESLIIKKAISKANKAYFTKRKRVIYAVAASVTILLSVIVVLNNSNLSSEKLYSFYVQKAELPSFIDRGETNLFSEGQIYFENKDYIKAKVIFSEAISSSQNRNASIYIYLALSQIELEEYASAENTLEQLINSNLLDAEKGYWYKSLLYLKSNQTEKLKVELRTIISYSYFKKEEAKELLNKIE